MSPKGSRKAPLPIDDASTLDRVTTEVRWILPASAGAVLVALRDDRPIEERVDTYLVPAKPSRWSVKRRGPDGVWEAKKRIGPVEHLDLRDVHGRAQRWRKVLVVEQHDAGRPVEVTKLRWRRQGLEVVQLHVEGIEAWSVGLRVGGRKVAALRRRCDELLGGTAAEPLLAVDLSRAYPEWLSREVVPTIGPPSR